MTSARSSETRSDPSGITSRSTGRPQARPSCSQPSAKGSYETARLLSRRTRVTPIADGHGTIPGAMLGDEDLVAICRGEHCTRIEAHAQRRDMGTEVLHRRGELGTLAFAAKLRVGNSAAMTIGIAKVHTRLWGMIEFIGGESSPSQSRPLSVNQSSLVAGCQSNPTVLRMPRAKVSRLVPSGRMTHNHGVAVGIASQILHGAPTGT